jgi:hypothetical protein
MGMVQQVRWTIDRGSKVFTAAAVGTRSAGLALTVFGRLGLTVLILAIASPSIQAQVGERNFFEPLITEDPNPSNALDIIPNWITIRGGADVAVAFSLEKELNDDFSVELASGWNEPLCAKGLVCDAPASNRRGRSRHRHRVRGVGARQESGFDDLEALAKYAFWRSDRHELRLAIGMDSFYPVGNPDAGAGTHTYLGPIFMYAKGMGDLPNAGFTQVLRPFAIQGDIYYLMKAGGTQVDDFGTDAVISYELYYLGSKWCDRAIPPIIQRLVPFAEFTYDQIVQARHGGTQPDLRALPGLAYMTNGWQISLAGELPLNAASVQFDHNAVFAMLSLTLDQIITAFGRNPF